MTNRFIIFTGFNNDILATNAFSIHCVQIQGNIGYSVYIIDQSTQQEFLIAMRASKEDALKFCQRVGAALTDESVAVMGIPHD